ncbi:MAG TPA: sugar kinase [Chloroflexota bacterium]|nr:sugar kinase [Chloroflexota bacterium]
MFDVTTIGEVMLRLSVPAGIRLDQAAHLDLTPGGAETNVTGALACLGRRCAWVSSLPANALGRLAANRLRAAGIDLAGVVWRERGRMGAYYLEFATPPRPIQAIYDRADSCAAQLTPDEVDWSYLLNTRLLHLSGITPALSPSCRAVTAEAVARAHAAGVLVSFDINYRQLLWSPEEAAEALIPLIQDVDLLLCGRRDAARVLGLDGPPEEALAGLAALSQARHIVLTLGAEGMIAWDGAQVFRQPAMAVGIVDRLGAGDALAAGIIHGLLDGDLALGLRYGATLAALALSQHGDMVSTTPEEVAALLAGSGGDLLR